MRLSEMLEALAAAVVRHLHTDCRSEGVLAVFLTAFIAAQQANGTSPPDCKYERHELISTSTWPHDIAASALNFARGLRLHTRIHDVINMKAIRADCAMAS